MARALDGLAEDVVFIGGAIAPLLQTTPVIPRVRPTDDVDAVVGSTHYGGYNKLEDQMRQLGFKIELGRQRHAHRWIAPDGTLFDLVPAGEHLGGTGGEWDMFAIETAEETEIESGLSIKRASATGFLALKWAAFWDRGVQDPVGSDDLEDILAILVSRDEIVSEFRVAPAHVQEHIRRGLRWLRDNADFEDLVAGHLGNAYNFSHVSRLLNDRINAMLAS